jgi:hypothetical protein
MRALSNRGGDDQADPSCLQHNLQQHVAGDEIDDPGRTGRNDS